MTTVRQYRLDLFTFRRFRERMKGVVFYRTDGDHFLIRIALPDSELRKLLKRYEYDHNLDRCQ